MSLFGSDETDADKRDYGFAFAALKSSCYLALCMAGRGHLSPLDAKEHSMMVRDGLSIVPERYLTAAGREAVEEALSQIEGFAEKFFRPGTS